MVTLLERAENYHKIFPKYPMPRVDSRWLDSMWVLGNNYKGSGYYGAYPPQYLKRMNALFFEKKKVLHLFSGSLPPGDYTRFDINSQAEVTGDAEELHTYFGIGTFDLVYADPPYSKEDALRYNFPMPNRKKVLYESWIVTQKGGHIVWLDTSLPMFSKTHLHLCGLIGIVRSTNHRFRVASIFEVL